MQAEYRDWMRPSPTLSLLIDPTAGETGAGATGRLRWEGSGPFPRPMETTRRIWFMAPDRLRVEIMRNGRAVRLGVHHCATWGRWDEVSGTETGDAIATERGWTLPPPLNPPLLAPARLLGWLRLHDVATGRRAGRAVLTARACPRTQFSAAREGLRYDLEFDAQHGTMLRLSTYDDRECLRLTEATEITYGRDLDPRLFTWPAVGVEGMSPPSGHNVVG
jgi:hypothetical protein